MRNLDASAHTIGGAIALAERSNSQALRDAGALLAAMTVAHLDSDVAIECDHESIEALTRSIGAHVEARGHYIAMHRRQSALARKLGIDVTAEGSCPPPPKQELTPLATPAPLRAVA